MFASSRSYVSDSYGSPRGLGVVESRLELRGRRSSYLPSLRGLAGNVRIEDVVGRVGHERLGADVCRGARRRRGHSSLRVHAVDEGAVRQLVATRWSVLDARHLKQEPGNGTGRDELGIQGRRTEELGPDGARVRRVLPRGANRSVLGGVGAEEVGDDLPIVVLEQGGLRGEEE